MSPLVIHVPYPGQALPAELFTADAPAGIGLVFAHGAGAGHRSPFMRRVAALLANRGLDVLTFDFPYMAAGRKLPDRPPTLEAACRAAGRSLVAESHGRVRALAIAGKSMGGRMATHVAAQPDAWDAPVPLVAAVAFGYPLKPPGPRGGDRISHLAALAVPVLVVQGTRDTFGGPDDLRDAITHAPHVTVRDVPTGDHSLKITVASGRRQDDVEAEIADDVVAFVLTAAGVDRG